MRLYLCGVRGSTPAPGADFLRYGGHTSCVALAHDGAARPVLVLDAGTGLRQVTGLLGGRPFEGTILLTHLHWDHVHGLPFFTAGDRDGARVSLLLPEQEDGASAQEALAKGMSPPHFPIGPDGLRGSWTFGTVAPGPFKAEGFTVEARAIPHKGGATLGYRVSDGSRAIAYLPDHCPTVLGPGPDGWGAYHRDALDLAADADLLIHDAFLLPDGGRRRGGLRARGGRLRDRAGAAGRGAAGPAHAPQAGPHRRRARHAGGPRRGAAGRGHRGGGGRGH